VGEDDLFKDLKEFETEFYDEYEAESESTTDN